MKSGPKTQPVVVILGAGFAGLAAARTLRKAPVRLKVIDRRNHHLFQPLLYQVATAGLNPSDIAAPIRLVLRDQMNTEVLLAEAKSIDLATGRLILDDEVIDYDWLVVAAGSTHSYFGHDDWEPLAPGLKTLEDALEIRRRILLSFEVAEREFDPNRRAAALTFVIVGAGPTGVELAGAVSEIARHTLIREFRHIDPRNAKVILVEAGAKVLSTYLPPLNEKALRQLEILGVEVRLGAPVTGIDDHGIQIGPERIDARTVLWASGVIGSPLAKTLGVPLDRAGRVLVEPNLSLPGFPQVYVVGDLAAFAHDGSTVPAVAPAAMQQGEHAAKNILRTLAGSPPVAFHYRDKGSLATIGRAAAVAQLGKLQLSGYWAWLAWAFIHIFFLIGFRNRVLVMIQWAWAYLTYDRGARLITARVGKILPKSKPETAAAPDLGEM